MYVFGSGGVGGESTERWVLALQIQWKEGECLTCICVWVAVVGGRLGPGTGGVR